MLVAASPERIVFIAGEIEVDIIISKFLTNVVILHHQESRPHQFPRPFFESAVGGFRGCSDSLPPENRSEIVLDVAGVVAVGDVNVFISISIVIHRERAPRPSRIANAPLVGFLSKFSIAQIEVKRVSLRG